MPFGQIFSKETQAIFYNWKPNPVQRMLDFDFLCGMPADSPSLLCCSPSISFCGATSAPGRLSGTEQAYLQQCQAVLPTPLAMSLCREFSIDLL